MKNNLKLSFFIPSLRGGGAERVFVTLANQFVQRGFMVDLILMQEKGPYLKDVSEKVNIVNLKTPRYSKALFPLIGYLKREKPDFLISALTDCNILSLMARYLSGISLKNVITEHTHFSISFRKSKDFKRKINKILAYLLYKKADYLIAVSKGVQESLGKELRIPAQRIRVIYNPIFDSTIIDKSNKEVFHPFFQDKKNRIILGAGSLTKIKDFPTLIKAFHIIREKQSLKLIILGEGGKNKTELEKLIKDLNLESEISLPGFVENPYAYMARADVFVLSSLKEGFGNVLVEAMACGANVVSTDCPSGPSEILDGGKYGKLVPVGNVEKLSEAIADSLKDPIEKEVLLNRARFFSVEKAVEEYQKIFKE